MNLLNRRSPLIKASQTLASSWKRWGNALRSELSAEELALYGNRDNVVTKLCEIQRLKSRAFLSKSLGETCKMSVKDIESLLFKNILADTRSEMEVIHSHFDHFYYRRMIKDNLAFQAALAYFVSIVEQFRILRRQYILAHGLASDKNPENAFKIARFDQLDLVEAIDSMKTVSKELRQWA